MLTWRLRHQHVQPFFLVLICIPDIALKYSSDRKEASEETLFHTFDHDFVFDQNQTLIRSSAGINRDKSIKILKAKNLRWAHGQVESEYRQRYSRFKHWKNIETVCGIVLHLYSTYNNRHDEWKRHETVCSPWYPHSWIYGWFLLIDCSTERVSQSSELKSWLEHQSLWECIVVTQVVLLLPCRGVTAERASINLGEFVRF